MLNGKQRIVLVENNPGDAFVAWEQLTEAHQGTVQVDVVPNLAETLALLALGAVDAIVLDLNLPDSQGLQTLRSVRQQAGAASIIVVTAKVTDALRKAALAEGAEEVYDKHDTQNCLFSRSVLYVVERNRARLQHARLQVLLDTLPDAVVIADEAGRVRFANPAALALFGHTEAGMLGEHIDFSAAGGDVVEVVIPQGELVQRCEMRVAPIEWEGQPARLASLKALAGHETVESVLQHVERLESAARMKTEILNHLSQQIRGQMQAISGLSELLGQDGSDPLQNCYIRSLHKAANVAQAALAGLPEMPNANAAPQVLAARDPRQLNSLLQALSSQRPQ